MPLNDQPHPLVTWWRTESRWGRSGEFPEDGHAEGRLAIESWNAAIDKAVFAVETYGVCAGDLDVLRELRYDK